MNQLPATCHDVGQVLATGEAFNRPAHHKVGTKPRRRELRPRPPEASAAAATTGGTRARLPRSARRRDLRSTPGSRLLVRPSHAERLWLNDQAQWKSERLADFLIPGRPSGTALLRHTARPGTATPGGSGAGQAQRDAVHPMGGPCGEGQGQVTRTMDSTLQMAAAVLLAGLVSVGAEAVRWPVTVTGPRLRRPSGTRKVLFTLAPLATAP